MVFKLREIQFFILLISWNAGLGSPEPKKPPGKTREACCILFLWGCTIRWFYQFNQLRNTFVYPSPAPVHPAGCPGNSRWSARAFPLNTCSSRISISRIQVSVFLHPSGSWVSAKDIMESLLISSPNGFESILPEENTDKCEYIRKYLVSGSTSYQEVPRKYPGSILEVSS